MPTETGTSRNRHGYSRFALMRRRWSHWMIVELLGEPDASEPNPIVPGGVRMQVFSFARVEAVEKTEAFAAAMATRLTSSNRRNAAVIRNRGVS
jgi:hypothetical protein